MTVSPRPVADYTGSKVGETESMSLKALVRQALDFLARARAPAGPSASPAAGDIRAETETWAVTARFAAGLAHDLNNILLVLQGYAELALGEPDAGPGVRALLDDMKSATARATRLVADLQAVGGRGPFTPNVLDLSEAIRRRLRAITAACPAGIEIRSALAEGLPPIFADEELVGRMLDALCARAREALPDGGTITVTTAPGGTDQWAGILRVHDTGAAINGDVVERLFQPYLPSPGGGAGQGLGMSLVAAAAKRLGGEVSVGTDDGTIIAVSFPGVPADSAGEEARPGESPSRRPEPARQAAAGATILLAEDDEDLRELAVKVLTREGYDVLPARDGQEAVDIFQRSRQRIKLALLDDVMPRMGGRAALSTIQGQAPGLPVILCSGYAWKFEANTPQSAGYCETLRKPWQPRELLQKVREGLESQR